MRGHKCKFAYRIWGRIMMYKVMIVDDEQNIREGILELVDWESLNCTIVGAMSNGDQAIQYLKENSVNIVITDIRMPIVDGITLAKYINKNHPAISVIILTAYSEFSYAKQAIKYQVADFVIKNEFLKELPEAVNRIIQTRDQGNNRTQISQGNSEIKGIYMVCAGEFRRTYHANIEEKMADLERLANVSIGDKGVLLFVNDETSFYIIIQNEECLAGSEHQITRKIEKFLALAKEFMQLQLRFGISEVLQADESISRGKKQSMEALAEIVDSDSVIKFYSSQGTIKREAPDWDADIYMRNLLSAIKEDQNVQIEKNKLEFARYLAVSGRRIEQCKSDTHAIASYLLRKFRHYYPNGEQPLKREHIFEMIYLAKSKASLIDIIEDVCNVMKELWSNKVSQKSNLVNQVDTIIEAEYQNKLGLKEISQRMFMSASYLSRVYKKETDLTVTEAISIQRIQRAKQLLIETNYKIYEIGSMVGIEDSAYFTHLFYKYEGENPSDYKSKYVK